MNARDQKNRNNESDRNRNREKGNSDYSEDTARKNENNDNTIKDHFKPPKPTND